MSLKRIFSRRQFLKNTSIGLLGTASFAGFYTWQVEPFWLEFVNRKMPVANLPENLIGKTLMQISDLHVGNRFDYQYLIDSFKKAKLLKPDYVVYTGDYISYESSKQFEQLRDVSRYLVKGSLATVGVLGNHDYGFNWSEAYVAEQVLNILESAGVKMLSNQQDVFDGLNFIGLDDFGV